ncbi:UNVERIFIED_CONTAM: hypothetical protein FKN15_057998 [Acipenser sinensis]
MAEQPLGSAPPPKLDAGQLHQKAIKLEQERAEFQHRKQQLEQEFNQKRAKFKELYLSKEEELKRQGAALESSREEMGRLQGQLAKAQAEMENIKAVATVSESTKQEAIDQVRRQGQEEVASLQAIMKETVREYELQFHHRLEQERAQWGQYREAVEREMAELRRRLSQGQEEENLENDMKKEVAALLQKQAVCMVHPLHLEDWFYSMPKQDGGLRPILNLRGMRFEKLTMQQLLQSFRPGDWFTTGDLKEAYFHIPIKTAALKYLQFAFGGTAYERVLPFGLSLAPHVFSKRRKAILALLRDKEFTTTWQCLEVGVMAGCTISPLAFTMAMEVIIRVSKWVVGEHLAFGMRLPLIRSCSMTNRLPPISAIYDTRRSAFISPGEQPPRKVIETKTHLGQLEAAGDWKMPGDVGQQLIFPPESATTNLRPDIVLWSGSAGLVHLAQEDAEKLRSVVMPMESEIAALKAKLTEAEDRVKELEASKVKELNHVLEAEKSCRTDLEMYVAVLNTQKSVLQEDSEKLRKELHEGVKELNHVLEAEKSCRTDLEMYVAVLNTQKSVLQEDSEKLRKELHEVCHLLELERQQHNQLKHTWQRANDQFLESQRLLMRDMQRIESVLSSEQLRQVEEIKKRDQHCLQANPDWLKARQSVGEAAAWKEAIEGMGTISPSSAAEHTLRNTLLLLCQYDCTFLIIPELLPCCGSGVLSVQALLMQSREQVAEELARLQRDNESLQGKHRLHLTLQQQENFTMPTAAEELQALVLRYREDMVCMRTEADHLEEKLKAEILFLKEQIQAEQCLKENLEETLQLEIDSCKEEIASFSSLKTELERVKSEKEQLQSSLAEKTQQLESLHGLNSSLEEQLRKETSTKARVCDGDRALLLDSPITPEHTFGPAVDEILQHSHCAWESTKELVRLFPKRPLQVHKPAANLRPRPQQLQRMADGCYSTASGGFHNAASRRGEDLRLSHKPGNGPRAFLPQAQGSFSGNHLEYWHQCTMDICVLSTTSLEGQVYEEKDKAQRLQMELDVSEQVQRDFVKLSQTLQGRFQKPVDGQRLKPDVSLTDNKLSVTGSQKHSLSLTRASECDFSVPFDYVLKGTGN